MYEVFFRFRERPFLAAPQAQRYFPAASTEAARVTLMRCIERAEGIGAIIGAPGTGKTLLCQVLANQLRGRYSVAMLVSGQLSTRRALLQAILFELGLSYRGLDEGELRLALLDHLMVSNATSSGLVLLVDEAHTLSWRLLEELRTMTNLVRDGQPRLRIVLAGGPRLEEHFAHPKMDSFSQRLAARCYLEALNREGTTAYVRSQVSACGGDPSIFQVPALESVHRATDGIPRLINQVCDHALVLACAAGRGTIGAPEIENAWADLQQLPAPIPQRAEAQNAPVVEFGGLDDASDDLPEAIPLRGAVTKQWSPTPYAGAAFEPTRRRTPNFEDDLDTRPTAGRNLEALFTSIDPFQEEFEDEEIVLDRYAVADAGTFAAHQTVSSREGSELSARLAPLTRPPQTVALHQAPSHSVGSQSIAQHAVDDPAITFKASSVLWPADGPVPQQPADARIEFSPTLAECAKSPVSRTDHDVFADDSDLIVVEDDPTVGATLVRPPLVRRQEYRQLFVTLRKGSEL